MNAPAPFPNNPTVGQWFQNWVWNGSRWVNGGATGMRTIITAFTANAIYMPQTGLVTVVVECYGGGGGGGNCAWTDPTIGMGGGGGGSGGYSRKALAAALVAGGVIVTVAPAAAPDQNGTATSFGALCIANGGFPGLGNTFGSQGGAEATPGIGDVAFAGSPGQNGPNQDYPEATSVTLSGGLGGSLQGGNSSIAAAPGQAQPGNPAWPNSGAGGQGAIINQAPTDVGNILGGLGGSGLCVTTEYCWTDASDDCRPCPEFGGARVAVTHQWAGEEG